MPKRLMISSPGSRYTWLMYSAPAAFADTEDHAAAREHVEAGDGLRDQHGIAQRQDDDVTRDAHARGGGGERGEHGRGFQDRRVPLDVVADLHGVEADR